ncbi:MAG: tRNA (N(6)-L-threonylcarbamoyladenosine(37)-C(2))-methylthiotransferase MtaB [Clostridia bacterium]|nr:tRNA (N(6)-L-threonylcarbamoyladenosine(37)-C(2))-methylthiotransferase MtaB [Clostridia bacterium]
MDIKSKQKTVAAHTIGCKVNQYDTQAMLEIFEQRGYKVVDFSEPADVYLVNTCTVTSTADKKSRQMLRQAKQNKDCVVIAAGCYSQRMQEDIYEYCDIAIGTADRNQIADMVEEYLENNCRTEESVIHNHLNKDAPYEQLFVTKLEGHTRAHMKIQEGCNNRCAYCIIPSVRGSIRSRTLEDIKKEAAALHKNNCKEVVLTGINLSSYGKDQSGKPTLYDVVKTIEAENIPRIRLGSIDPGTFQSTPQLLENISALCPQFHISLQSGCDKTLKSMNRWYTTEKYLKEVDFIRSFIPDAAITTDIIVGFPGETEADFSETLAFVEKVQFSRIHVFPFSPRPNTKAYDMKAKVPKAEKNKRVHQLIDLGEKLEQEYMKKFIGKTVSVLFETNKGNIYTGYSKEYIPVNTSSPSDIKTQLINVKIAELGNGYLLGQI